VSNVAIAFAASLALTFWFASAHSPFAIMDTPNERSLHESPTPRTGGIAMLTGLALAWGYMALSGTWPSAMNRVAVAASIVAGVSLLDDFKGLPPLPRFATHGLAAAVLVAGGLTLPWSVAGNVIAWLGIVWMLNLYNFMDGMDGFAAGMSVAGFGFLGVAGWLAGAEAYAWLCWTTSAVALGFLCLNFPPARIFMGDAGSATLGLLAAAFSLWGIDERLFHWWFPFFVFAPFILDATTTLVRRLLRGERIWEAHRTHYYQRLVQAGWGHERTVLVEYALMLILGGGALLVQIQAFTRFLLPCLVLLAVALMVVVDAYVGRHAGHP